MKKTLLLVVVRKEIGEMYMKDLQDIFGDFLEVKMHSAEGSSISIREQLRKNQPDLIVSTNSVSYEIVAPVIDSEIPVIPLSFSFSQKNLTALQKYPEGTEAYVGFTLPELSREAISILYSMGIRNLRLKVYDPWDQNPPRPEQISLGLVGTNSNCFPDSVTNLISLGERKLSLNTIAEIAARLDLPDHILSRAISLYSSDASGYDSSVSYLHRKSESARVQLRTIVDCIDDGFLMVDQTGTILDCNHKMQSLFHLPRSPIGRSLSQTPELDFLRSDIEGAEELENRMKVIPHSDRHILLSKKYIRADGAEQQMAVVILKDVTKLINLETSYRTQLAKKGHVTRYDFDNIWGISPAIRETIEKARRIAAIDKPTLIVGESGTGKELFVQSIHHNSSRRNFSFVAINCAALPATLLESELFGYAEGAFTGARKGGRQGLFEMANRGTLFLDEIGEMSFETQAKLLRVLEEKEVMRLGSGEIISVDVRIIAATNKNLKELVRQGKFRADLFFRLNTITLHIPPLRSRPGDIDYLTRHFMENESCGVKEMDESVHRFMNAYLWEGNVRELKNCVEFMVNISDDRIHMSHLPEYMLEEELPDPSLNGPSELPSSAAAHISRLDRDVSVRILELLSRKNMGRRALLAVLRSEGRDISEYRLRAILTDLKEKGYVLLSSGRSGASLTVEGSHILPVWKC